MVDTAMASLSNALVYSAMVVYTLAFLAFIADLAGAPTPAAAGAQAEAEKVGAARQAATASGAGGSVAVAVEVEEAPRRRKAAAIGMSLTWLALAVHLGAVVARGLSVHRAPWGNMYEYAVAGSMVVAAVYLLLSLRTDLRFLGAFITGPVLLTMGLAVAVLYTEATQLVPALQSVWLAIHVSVAFIASALLTMGFSTTVLYLVQDRREKNRSAGTPNRRGAFMDRMPTSETLDRLSYQLHTSAFPMWTFSVIAGAIWAEHAWNRYWGWDPKEVWSFVIWVVYASYLHARLTRGWDGRRASYIALLGFACLLINFLVVNIWFVGKHSYAGVGG